MTSPQAKAMLGLAASALCAPAIGHSLLSFGDDTPLICRFRLTAAPGGAASFGDITEFCNGAHGYEVWANHPPASPTLRCW